jgi:hypothetical protein
MMNDASQNTITSEPPMTEREQALAERAGSRILVIWLLAAVIAVETLIIVHLVR